MRLGCWEAQTWVSLRNSPSVEENLWSAPRPETPDDMGDDTQENFTWIWDRYCQWLGRGNFGRRWYNVLIWSDFGVQGCRPCFSYPCQNLLVPLSKVKDDLTIIRLHWSSTQSSLSFYRPNYLLRTLLYCTHHSYSKPLSHALVRSFSSSGALWAQEGLSTLTCKTSCAKQDTSKLLGKNSLRCKTDHVLLFVLWCLLV